MNFNHYSKRFVDMDIMGRFLNDPEFTYLISFPRTGSHWLRFIMEIYFEKPALTRAFYYYDAVDFTCLHHHDLGLHVYAKNVIYLYREPLSTIYSQLMYHQQDLKDEKNITYWAELYGKHLNKWINEESFSNKKTIICYEKLQKNLDGEFKKICHHFNLPFDENKLHYAQSIVTKEHIKNKTVHDPQVINNSKFYNQNKNSFIAENESRIRNIIGKYVTNLHEYLEIPLNENT